MRCGKCGRDLAFDAKFCPTCGQKVVRENSSMAAQGFAKAGDLGAPTWKAVDAKPQPVIKIVPEPVVPVRPARKYCVNCGNVLPDDACFCNVCGNRVEGAGTNAAARPAAPVAPVPPVRPAAPVAPVPPVRPAAPVTPAPPVRPVAPVAPVPPTRPAAPAGMGSSVPAGKMSKGVRYGLLGGGAAVAVLLLVLLLGTLTNWFGMSGPATKIASACANTFGAKSFTVDFVGDVDDGVEGTAYVQIDYKNQDLTVYTEARSWYGDTYTFAIYDGYAIFAEGNRYYKENIRSEIADAFEAYEEGTDSDTSWEDMLDKIDEDVYEEACEYIDFEALEKCIRTYFKKLNNEKWLEKNAGYSVSRKEGMKVYSFNCDVVNFVEASAENFEDAFVDSYDYYDFYGGIDEIDYHGDTDVEMSVGIKGGKLKHVVFAGLVDNEETIYVEAEFSDIGKTKIDTSMLEYLLKKAD